jgi:hypothetical protein
MKILIRNILIFITLTAAFSCEELESVFINCAGCYPTEPVETDIRVKLEKFDVWGLARIDVYEGNIEDSVLFRSFQSSREEYYIKVPVNKRYTVSARYTIGIKTYLAIDGCFPRVKYDKESCEEPCYYVYDRIVNLRIKE